MHGDGEARSNGVVGRHEEDVRVVAAAGVAVDGEVPVVRLSAIAEAAQGLSRVADVAEAVMEGRLERLAFEGGQLFEDVLAHLLRNALPLWTRSPCSGFWQGASRGVVP